MTAIRDQREFTLTVDSLRLHWRAPRAIDLEYRGTLSEVGVERFPGPIAPVIDVERPLPLAVEPVPVARNSVTVDDTARLITDPDTGKYPHPSPFRDELLRALLFAGDVLGPGTAWESVDESHWTMLLRRRCEGLVAKKYKAVRATEITRFLGVGIPIRSPAVGRVNVREISPVFCQERVGYRCEAVNAVGTRNRTHFFPRLRPSFRAPSLVMSRTITGRSAMTEGQRRIAAAQRARWPQRTLAERFWEKVDRSGECWLWTGCRDSAGYGVIRVNGNGVKAHRIAYELANGPIPSGMLILHACDNPPCVRPDHLRPGTHTDNAEDRVSRGRCAKTHRTAPLKTTCVNGHPFDSENTRMWRGFRLCRACGRENMRRHRQRRRTAVAS